MDDPENTVTIYLAHAPRSLVARLEAAHPGIYVVHDDAPRPRHAVTRLMKSFDWNVLKPEGIRVVAIGPSEDGYLRVGVTSDVAKAQQRLDAIYGRNLIRAHKTSAAVAF